MAKKLSLLLDGTELFSKSLVTKSVISLSQTEAATVLFQQEIDASPPPPPPPPPPSGTYTPIPAPRGTIVTATPSGNIQALLNSVPAGGTLVVPAGRTIGGLRGKSGIMLWADGVVSVSGNLDFSGLSNWVIKGKAPGQGFLFNGTRVTADNSINGIVGNCIFNNTPSNGQNGSAVALNGATGTLVINDDFNHCQGNVLGCNNLDNVIFDGLRMDDCMQCWSIDQPADPNRGRNIKVLRCVVTLFHRSGFETGGTVDGTANSPGQVFTGLVLDGNWFADYGPMDNPGTGAISLVARTQRGTKVINNFVRIGTIRAALYNEAVEINSTAEPADVSGNLFVDVTAPVVSYGSAGASAHDNRLFNCGSVPGSNNVVLPSRPPDPPRPTRVVW